MTEEQVDGWHDQQEYFLTKTAASAATEILTADTTILILGTEPLAAVTYVDYAVDDEGWAAGVFKYLCVASTLEHRPRAGSKYSQLILAYEDLDGELRNIIEIPNVGIVSEHVVLDPTASSINLLEVECRWSNV